MLSEKWETKILEKRNLFMTIKNFWSLSTDEAIVAEKIKKELGKVYEVFFPINSQLKDIDLVVFNLRKGSSITVQVKGSRTYSDKYGQWSWITVPYDKIFRTTNKTDFFIFVWHILNQTELTRKIEPAYIVIPLKDLQKKCKNEKNMRSNRTYHFVFKKDSDKKAYDYPAEKNAKKEKIDFSKYLNKFELLK